MGELLEAEENEATSLASQLECVLLNQFLVDDFESGEIGIYTVQLDRIEAGGLETFELHNHNCPLLNDTWDIESVYVEAMLDDGS